METREIIEKTKIFKTENKKDLEIPMQEGGSGATEEQSSRSNEPRDGAAPGASKSVGGVGRRSNSSR